MKKMIYIFALLFIGVGQQSFSQPSKDGLKTLKKITLINNRFEGVTIASAVYEKDSMKIVSIEGGIVFPEMIILLSNLDFDRLATDLYGPNYGGQIKLLKAKEYSFIHGARVKPIYISEDILKILPHKHISEILVKELSQP